MPLTNSTVVFSLVSHGQLGIVRNFLSDFVAAAPLAKVTLVLTLNIPEDELCLAEFAIPNLHIIRNAHPKGFGANHNRAAELIWSDYFVIVNPDIRLQEFSMDALLEPFADPGVGATAPVVYSSEGAVEDSVRRYPTLFSLTKRAFFGRPGPDYSWGSLPILVDWSAGMFVAFRRTAFLEVGGFDERYFMYYEDADIGRRLALHGWTTMLQPACKVIHDAQRASRHSMQHLSWHLRSLLRFIFIAPRQSK